MIEVIDNNYYLGEWEKYNYLKVWARDNPYPGTKKRENDRITNR